MNQGGSPAPSRYSLHEASLGSLKPSLSVYLNASNNVQDHVGKNNSVVKGILKDLERVKRLAAPKNHEKRTQHIEKLVFFIVQTLRRVHSDHLMQTTVIWVLINLLRIDFQFSRKVMVGAGVPGVLFDIMSSHVLSGATRQYASELCYFLCSDDPQLDPRSLPDMQGPVGKDKLPDVSFTDRISKIDGSTSLDEGSFLRSVESSYSGVDDKGSLPFVPYVIDSKNMEQLDSLFNETARRFDDGRAQADSSRHPLLSQTTKSKRKHIGNDDDDDTLSTTSDGSISIAAIDMLSQSLGFEHLDKREKLANGELPPTKTGKGKSLFTLKPKVLGSQGGLQLELKKKATKTGPTSKQEGYGTGAGAVQGLQGVAHASNIHNDNYDHTQGMYGFDNMSVGGMSLDSFVSRADSSVAAEGRERGSIKTGGNEERKQAGGSSVLPSTPKGALIDDNASAVTFASKPNTPHTARTQQRGVDRFLTSFDPLALTHPGKSANDTIRMPEPDGFRNRPMTSELNDDEDSVHTHSSDGGLSSDDDLDFVDEMKEHLDSQQAAIPPKRKPKKLRIRAEKLMDHQFTEALFSKKVSVEETQSLIRRLTDMLELVDTEKSGYVTWAQFGRVITALAPQDLLRSDVDEFLSAQVKDNDDLINYREFVISGKVTIIEKINGRSILPINGWLERQKEYVGDATTYTWKNHQSWYNERKRTAVVWLMRRATTALTQEVSILEAARFLFHEGDKAKAVTGLLEFGYKATEAHRKRADAKKRLLRRCMHARQAAIRKEDAFVYLRELAIKVVKTEAILAAKDQEITYEDVLEEPVDQANISNIFFTYYNHIEAQKWMLRRSNRALLHSKAQDDAQASLAGQAKRFLTQMILTRQAADWLMAAADRYHEYCCVQDNVALALLRIGNHALAYFDRQTDALAWLLARGKRAEEHSAKQDEAGASLVAEGQYKLRILNDRENSVAYLKRRRYNAEALIINKIAAIAFLRGQVRAFESAGKATGESEAWLKKRGVRAVQHTERQFKALRRLNYVGGRSKVVHKRATAAFIDLHQIGQWARVTNFNNRWPNLMNNANEVRLQEEVDRLDEKLVRTRKERIEQLKDKPIEDSWEVELHEAFKLLGKNIFMPGESVNDKKSLLDISKEPMLSKVGFLKLMLNGALVDRSKHEIIQDWHHIDLTGIGFVSFHDVWYWFKEVALSLHKKCLKQSRGRKPFTFHSQQIVSTREQALFVFKARFALQEKKIAEGKSGHEDEDEESEDEESEDEESEEESEEDNSTVTVGEYDRIFMRLFEQHNSKGLETFAVNPAVETADASVTQASASDSNS